MIFSWKVIAISVTYFVNSRAKIKKMKEGNFKIENSICEKLLGNHFDNRLSFDYQILELCKKS